MAFNTDLTWIQDGENISGGVNGDSTGILNRPLLELLESDTYLNQYKMTAILPFTAGEITAIYTACIVNAVGKMIIADYDSVDILTSFVGIALNNIDNNAVGLYQVGDIVTNVAWTWTIGSPVYIGNAGALTQTLPSNPRYPRLVGYALTATSIYLK